MHTLLLNSEEEKEWLPSPGPWRVSSRKPVSLIKAAQVYEASCTHSVSPAWHRPAGKLCVWL